MSDSDTEGPDRSGAESLVQTFVDAGVDVCFANPGTSEMHFVAALDTNPEMRCVLGLFEENVCSSKKSLRHFYVRVRRLYHAFDFYVLTMPLQLDFFTFFTPFWAQKWALFFFKKSEKSRRNRLQKSVLGHGTAPQIKHDDVRSTLTDVRHATDGVRNTF